MHGMRMHAWVGAAGGREAFGPAHMGSCARRARRAALPLRQRHPRREAALRRAAGATDRGRPQ